MKPKIRILPDAGGMCWCGLFGRGYSSFGRVGVMPLEQAIAFYLRILAVEGLAQ
jgi:hypothetical protein